MDQGVVWREALEFSNAKRLEPGIGASIHRYGIASSSTRELRLRNCAYRVMRLCVLYGFGKRPIRAAWLTPCVVNTT